MSPTFNVTITCRPLRSCYIPPSNDTSTVVLRPLLYYTDIKFKKQIKYEVNKCALLPWQPCVTMATMCYNNKFIEHV